MTQIKITSSTFDIVTLEIDPKLFNDIDAAAAGQTYNCELNFDDSDFDCEFDNCTRQTLPSISFLDMAPAQSVMTNCAAHYPVVLDLALDLIDASLA